MVKVAKPERCLPCFEVFVDYALVGFALEFPIALTRAERLAVKVGSVLLITGDGVDDRLAEIISVEEDPWVVVRLFESHKR